ncbi:hypothetical protein ACFFQF_11085 [Haladaptatus pallidirubidus]|uniref:hypothetical protein n=1 Tax=Haladaptatus pallidirubidus TaxID=1008152 RepID=UPI001D12508D|nr:hypothetical protein [Haladaptatus pallidirubidus]
MNRRAVASLLGSVVSAGCLEVLQSSAETNEKVVGLRINNLFDGSRTVDIEISPLQETTTDERSFANSFDIEADSDVRKERPVCRRLQRHCSNHKW